MRVNDRGPFSRSRILDVSHDAAEQLEMFKSGIAKVKAMVVGDNGMVVITRPESIIENSLEMIGPPEEEDKITVITPPIVAKKKTVKPKSVKKKPKKKTPTKSSVKTKKK